MNTTPLLHLYNVFVVYIVQNGGWRGGEGCSRAKDLAPMLSREVEGKPVLRICFIRRIPATPNLLLQTGVQNIGRPYS